MNELRTQSDRYLQRVLVTVGIVGALAVIFLFLWHVSRMIFIIFGATLFAIVLDWLARVTQGRMKLSRGWSLSVATLALLLVMTGFVWGAGPQVSEQAAELGKQIPEGVEWLQSTLREQPWGRLLLETTPEPKQLIPAGTAILDEISGVFSTAIGTVVDLGLILVIGFYLALEPGLYIAGVLALVPQQGRARGQEILRMLGHALRWWLVGRLASMTVVGILTTVALWIIGLPQALALGLIAGLLSFIPYIGPVLSAIPALLIGLIEGPWMALQVLVVYSGVQFLEGNLITPYIQKHTVALAPVMLLTAQLSMGLLFGFLGILFATPLAVVIIVLIQTLYVGDVLGDRGLRVLGQPERVE